MSDKNTIWTPPNIILFGFSCIILILLFSFCFYRLFKKIKGKKHLKNISKSNTDIIREHMKMYQIGEPIRKTWIELSNICFALLDDYCRDKDEVVWIMNQKVWPIIDDMAYQDQKKAISDLKILGGSSQIQVFPFEKEKWHKAYVKAKKFMM